MRNQFLPLIVFNVLRFLIHSPVATQKNSFGLGTKQYISDNRKDDFTIRPAEAISMTQASATRAKMNAGQISNHVVL
jgi:hypothetical protein